MAEGELIDDLLGAGGEETHGETRAPAADAFAAAIAVDHARHDPALARKAGDYLDRQSRLIDLQIAHFEEDSRLLEEERRLAIGAARRRRFADRMKNGLQVFAALAASVVGLGLIIMLTDALASRSVIVEPFDAPPALAARGLSGRVIAGALFDELTRLQAVTRSTVAKRNLSNAWTGDIKVEVPETGVSIGEIGRLLHQRFGHDLHIGGDLVQTDTGGLALTVRGDNVLPKVFTGGPGDLDRLTAQAAEYIYGQSQPALFTVYLTTAGRSAEAVAFSKAAYSTASLEDRPYLLNTWANALSNVGGSPREALALYRQALILKPDYWTAYNNVMNGAWILGDEEGAWRTGEKMRDAAGGRPGRAPEIDYVNWDVLTWNLQAWRSEMIADALATGGIGAGVTANGPQLADVDVRLHDPGDAEFQLQTAKADPKDTTIAAMTHFIHGRVAAMAGDTQRAAAEMEAFGAAYADPQVTTNYPGYACWIAPAEEAAGYPDKADAARKAGGHFVDCYRFEGDILDHRGDWAGAQRAYATAVAIAPDLPAGYYSWGVALAGHGDLAAAQAKLAAAHARGPHWGDPLKVWGDVLGRDGRWKEALAKYDQALKYAPAWAELHRARAFAARRA